MFEMLGNVLKNLISRPATRLYPYKKKESFRDTRGSVGINIDTCIFCGICSKKCPSKAINVDRSCRSWEIDPFKCILCGYCAEVCPKKCLYMEEAFSSPVYCKETLKHVQGDNPREEARVQNL